MDETQRHRAAAAVRARLEELNIPENRFHVRAGLDRKTVAAFLSGSRWPTRRVRALMAAALGWKSDQLDVVAGPQEAPDARVLSDFTTQELLGELNRRDGENRRRQAETAPPGDQSA